MSLVNVIFQAISTQLGRLAPQSIHVHTIWGPVVSGSQNMIERLFGLH